MGPSSASGPGLNGMTMVVAGDGLNIPRIQIERSPVSLDQGFTPMLVTWLSEANATILTPAGTGTPSALTSSGLRIRTSR